MTHRPVENGVTFATSGTSQKSTAISGKSTALRIVATGQNTFVAIGTEPTATTANYAIPKDSAATLAFSNTSASISAYEKGSTTTLTFPEGTTSPFIAGDYVSFSNNRNSAFNFSHKRVKSVIGDGTDLYNYIPTKVVVEYDSSSVSGTITLDDCSAVLRSSFKVAARTDSGAGVVYIQQIQITGDA